MRQTDHRRSFTNCIVAGVREGFAPRRGWRGFLTWLTPAQQQAFVITALNEGLILDSVPLPQFQPMPLGRIREPFSDPNWLFEIEWDGFRAGEYLADCAQCSAARRATLRVPMRVLVTNGAVPEVIILSICMPPD